MGQSDLQALAEALKELEAVLMQQCVLVEPPDAITKYREDQERDYHGRFAPEGAGGRGGGQGAGKPVGQEPSAGTGNAGKSPIAFTRRSPTNAERIRGVVGVYKPTPASAKALTAAGTTPVAYHEIAAEHFRNAIAAAKTGKFAAAVTVKSPDEYKAMRTFLTPDGKAGFALDGDDLVSAFKHPDSTIRQFADSALALGTQLGGRRIDCFDTVLPEIYSKSGFRAVARLAWDDKYAPPDWDKTTFAKFNSGRPDVVFMVHDAKALAYRAGTGARVKDYDAGIAAQRAALGRAIKGFNPDQPRDDHGRWTSGGGGETRPLEIQPKPLSELPRGKTIEAKVLETARAMEFPEDKIEFKNEKFYFKIGSEELQRQAAGLYDPLTGKVTIYPNTLGEKTAQSVVAHEIMHHKYQVVLNRIDEEERALAKDPRVATHKNPDGTLRWPLDKKYPVYNANQSFFHGPNSEEHNWRRMFTADDISDYANAYSKEALNGKLYAGHAWNENFAEMGMKHYESGIIQGPKPWRDFFKMMQRAYTDSIRGPKWE